MPIKVVCPACQAALTVKDEFAGRKGKCPKCQGALQIPAASAPAAAAPVAGNGSAGGTATATVTKAATKPAPAATKPAAAPQKPAAAAAPPAPQKSAAPANPTEWKAALDSAFRPEAEAEFAKLTSSGGVGLLMQTGIMSLLALGYIVVLGVLGIALYWWGTHGNTFHPALWLGPLALGGLVLLLLLKPLFAPAHARGAGRELAKDESLFIDFVHKLCTTMSCQKPQRIEVDSNLETWAGMQRGKLVLRVGLPLAAMLPVDQLAGLMAGQLGQYPQGSAGSRRRFIRSIYRWYSRAVFGVDAWDEKLIVAARRSGIATRWIYQLLRVAPKIAALLLWPLAVMSRAFGEGATQALDKHAEKCSLTLIGSKTTLATMQRMRIIRFLWSQVQGDIGMQIREKQVPDNLPQVLVNQLRDTPQEVLALATGFDQESSDLTDATEAQRIEAARAFTGEGVFACPLPAAGLFRDFGGVAKVVTADFYTYTFGKQFNRPMLRKV